jgi:hypothetical protein
MTIKGSYIKGSYIGHCQDGSSDKIYIASIVPENDVFRVVGFGGRVGKQLRKYDKGVYSSIDRAVRYRDELFVSKLKKGYQDIENQNLTLSCRRYYGDLSKESLEQNYGYHIPPPFESVTINELTLPAQGFKDWDLASQSYVFDESGESDEAKLETSKDWEVKCLNNIGMEDSFNEDVTYIAERHQDDDMIFVWDKNGEKKECFKERFSKTFMQA